MIGIMLHPNWIIWAMKIKKNPGITCITACQIYVLHVLPIHLPSRRDQQGMCPPQQQDKNGNAQVSRTDKLFPFEGLASLENRQERDDRRASFRHLKSITISCLHTSIAMPDGEKMMQD
jgi:hypothetical protein